jgi:hydroxymethylbilane synthase
MRALKIGTRGSALALWQANHVRDRLLAGGVPSVELVVIKTKGDKILDVPLAAVGGKGLFVKEIEDALLRGEVDLAVHSMKDVPTEQPDGLVLSAVSAREDARDAVVGKLGQGARVGTSSLRRMCQLRAWRPDLSIVSLRGNVDTRLKKLDAGELDAVVLAAAGLQRLGFAARIAERLPTSVSLPAIGQGALALETRGDDAEAIAAVRAAMHDEESAACVAAERALLARLQGGCQTPIAGHAVRKDGAIVLEGLVGAPDGSRILRDRAAGADPRAVGLELAERLLAAGAEELLRAGS